MVRMTLTEPQTAFAGVMLKISLVRFKASMATFSEERTLSSERFDRWGFGVMVDMRVQHPSCEEDHKDVDERSSRYDMPRAGRAAR